MIKLNYETDSIIFDDDKILVTIKKDKLQYGYFILYEPELKPEPTDDDVLLDANFVGIKYTRDLPVHLQNAILDTTKSDDVTYIAFPLSNGSYLVYYNKNGDRTGWWSIDNLGSMMRNNFKHRGLI